MPKNNTLIFKIATEEDEFEQIHKLNYKTFVEELDQHESNEEQKLIDQFHDENTYIIGLEGKLLAGMVALRDNRPFSLDQKLDNLDDYLPNADKICEMRLLAINQGFRFGSIFKGMLEIWTDYMNEGEYDLGIISGTIREKKLYSHLGFISFGPIVGEGETKFQPMYITREALNDIYKRYSKTYQVDKDELKISNFLPGPVNILPEILAEFSKPPNYHRTKMFIEDYNATKNALCEFTRAKNVQLLMGSGTLANDVVAGQLSIIEKPGVILSNGEFGSRLVKQGNRHNLKFEALELEWGEVFSKTDIVNFIEELPEINWLWTVHCETSTGVINDINLLRDICSKRKIRLSLDCMSSIGTIPIDLNDIYLASCSSSKGIGSLTGISMVFHDHEVYKNDHLPSYIDLGYYAETNGPPFTISSNLIYALRKAVELHPGEERYQRCVEQAAWIKENLISKGFEIVAPQGHDSPAVITIALPIEIDSLKLGEELGEEGFLLSYGSYYLVERNWIQIILMGEVSKDTIKPLLNKFKELVASQTQN